MRVRMGSRCGGANICELHGDEGGTTMERLLKVSEEYTTNVEKLKLK
jgi:hypothetical protein